MVEKKDRLMNDTERKEDVGRNESREKEKSLKRTSKNTNMLV